MFIAPIFFLPKHTLNSSHHREEKFRLRCSKIRKMAKIYTRYIGNRVRIKKHRVANLFKCYLALAFQPLCSLKSRKIVLFPGTHSTRQELLVKGSTQPSQDIYHQEALFSSRSRENRVYKEYVYIFFEVVDTYCRVGRN